MDIDVTDYWAPTSEQMDAVDLPTPRIFTVTSATQNSDKGRPVNVHFAEFDRPWRPGKSMGRVLRQCWGPKTAAWIGHRVELFCDPEVTYGKDKVGGIRIGRLSHIDGPQRVLLLISQGRSSVYNVQPLTEPVARDWKSEADDLAAVVRVDALYALHAEAKASGATPDDLAHIIKRGREAKAAVEAAKAEDVES